MSIKLRYEAQKGRRYKRRFIWATHRDPMGEAYWFSKGRWTRCPDKDHRYSNCAPCRTVKAFRRMLKKAPIGVEFILVSDWRASDVFGRRKGNV